MSTTIFKNNEIILLLGAGASVEADILDSKRMVREIERLVYEDSKWISFKDLYNYVRSSVFYADGLEGTFGDDVPFNIERLVNVLDELRKKERHTLYPFVGAWNPKLLEVAGDEFSHVKGFHHLILQVLRNKWVVLPKKEKAAYYSGLLKFQEEYGYPLRVFSLNYDLCVEAICGQEAVQRGFVDDRSWDWRSFDETSEDPKPLKLYKLHGSVDWLFTKDGGVTYSDSSSTIEDDNIALIFGTSYKLQYVDPFLYLVYELRRWTLDAARIIICVGYGFNDDHINGILQQSLRQDTDRKLLAVIEPSDRSAADKAKERVGKQLSAQEDQIIIDGCGAKKFFLEHLTIDLLSQRFPVGTDLIPPLSSPNLESD